MIALTILGQPVSKSNRSEIITIAGHASLVKSKEARRYHRNAVRQIPPAARQRLQGPVRVTMRLHYASERPDLDESLVLDALQDQWQRGERDGYERVLLQPGVYRNDRQVREKHVYHAIDAFNPRAEIEVEPMHAQQVALDLPAVLTEQAF
jgi:Holliday junction resolvase RusA-like endonuclease